MIYEIDESCLETISTEDTNCIAFLEQLALDRRKCKNVIVAQREVFAQLANTKSLSEVSRKIYKVIGNRVSEHKLLLKYAKKYCRIVAENNGNSIIYDGDKEIFLLKIDEAVSKDFTSKSLMLAENEDDISFYKLLGQYYVLQSDIGNIKIDFEPRNGGGSTTYMVLQGILSNRDRMCLCIVDSDKKYANAMPRETMQKVEETIDGIPRDHFEVVFLDVHEIENLVPLNVLDAIAEKLNISNKGIEFMRFLLANDSSKTSPVFYYDVKKGIPRNAYILEEDADDERKKKYRKLEEYRKYWRPYIENFGAEIETEADAIIVGVCDKTLKHALIYLDLLKKEKRMETLVVDSHLKETWLELGEKVYCWGCVGGRLAV